MLIAKSRRLYLGSKSFFPRVVLDIVVLASSCVFLRVFQVLQAQPEEGRLGLRSYGCLDTSSQNPPPYLAANLLCHNMPSKTTHPLTKIPGHDLNPGVPPDFPLAQQNIIKHLSASSKTLYGAIERKSEREKHMCLFLPTLGRCSFFRISQNGGRTLCSQLHRMCPLCNPSALS